MGFPQSIYDIPTASKGSRVAKPSNTQTVTFGLTPVYADSLLKMATRKTLLSIASLWVQATAVLPSSFVKNNAVQAWKGKLETTHVDSPEAQLAIEED